MMKQAKSMNVHENILFANLPDRMSKKLSDTIEKLDKEFSF
jgi:hypothetical protein